MVLDYSDVCSDQLSPDQRYTDPALKPATRAGEMDAVSLRQMQQLLRHALNDTETMNLWFGRHMTQPKNPDSFQPADSIPDLRNHTAVLVAHPAARFAWQQQGEDIVLFANGETLRQSSSPLVLKLVQQLATFNSRVATSAYRKHKACRSILESLLAQGALLIEGEQ
jgi:50S ribosomal protein L16 3-hydroxylase